MARKSAQAGPVAADKQLAAAVRESAEQIWLAGLGAFAKAQQGGSKVFEALVQEGDTLQLDRIFEDRVARALTRLGVPSSRDVRELTALLQALNNRIETLRPEPEGRPAGGGVPPSAAVEPEPVVPPKQRRRRAGAAAEKS